ncbi:MAG: hypothetical protein AAGH41_13370 [Pseudomonadota bacterium]
MRFAFASLASLALSFGSFASAATIYATAVDWVNNGTTTSANNRDNPVNALGAPDGSFLALGLSTPNNPGFAVFSFGQQFQGAVSVIEVTFGCQLLSSGACSHSESVDVLAGDDYAFGSNDFSDLSDFTFVGSIINGMAQGGTSLALPGSFTYLAIVDTTRTLFPNSPSTDGFDVESVGVTLANQAVPVPAAGLLIAPFALLAARRKRA